MSPATKGSSVLYRRFVHPALCKREAEIDEAISRATEQGYTAVLQLGSKGVNYATNVLMQTAIKVNKTIYFFNQLHLRLYFLHFYISSSFFFFIILHFC